MFREETVFILGAGASKPYGYPLGKELINKIITNIENDYTLYPCSPSGTLYSLKDCVAKLKDVNKKIFDHQTLPNDEHFRKTTLFNIERNHYKWLRFSEIEEFFKLRNVLIDFAPISIDTFLRDNPSYEIAGKTMIVYSLLAYEDISSFYFDQELKRDNWYSFLINDILSGCTDPQSILNNKVKFITFNYDLSLEYCLFKRLSQVESFKEVSSQFIEQLKNEHIKHVYGQLYDYAEIQDYGALKYGSKSRFLRAINSVDKIKVVHDRYQNQDHIINIKKILKTAKELIIIGFGFDRENLSILGFPQQMGQYTEFLGKKKLKYMDYRGEMNSLYEQFKEIEKNINFSSEFRVIRSTAENIVEAYQNDFKIYLF